MLTQIQISNRLDSLKVFQDYSPEKQTWVVSDLRSKLEIQQILLEKNSSFEDLAVLRVSDLWKLLLKRSQPQMRLASLDFISGMIRNFIRQSDQLALKEKSDRTLLAYMQSLAPIVFHPSGRTHLMDWFTENPKAADRWSEWFGRAYLGHQFLLSQDIMSTQWLASYMQSSLEFHKIWDRDLIFDLGPELSAVEADLIHALSRVVDVKVIEPIPDESWAHSFHFLLSPYADLRAQAKLIQKTSVSNMVSKNLGSVSTLRFSSALAEVRHACNQVRQWMSQDEVAAADIAVIAPDIEAYWPVLSSLFECEGIPVSKDHSSALSSLALVQRWLSLIRLRAGKVDEQDLEASYYAGNASQMRYEEFQALFSLVFEAEDLKRDARIFQWYQQGGRLNSVMKRNEFASAIVLAWPDPLNLSPLETFIREIFSACSEKDELPIQDWISYLEKTATKKETTIQKGNPQGVQVLSLMSGQSMQTKKRIFLGLAEENMRSRSLTVIQPEERESLFRNYGFLIDSEDQSFRDFELRWNLQGSECQDILCFSSVDLSGKQMSPSSIWIEFRLRDGELESLDSYQSCRWDDVLKSQDGEMLTPARLLPQKGSLFLSASAVEDYKKCPFVYAAQRVFRLKSVPEIDMDIDARSGGSFAHSLFESLCIEPFQAERSEEDLFKLIDQIKDRMQLRFGDERIWRSYRSRYLKLAQNFLKFEAEWRLRFPATRTLAREMKFEVVDSELDLKFVGKIDRVDWDQKGNFVLLDYKSSTQSKNSFPSWFEKADLQLMAYLWAFAKQEKLENGLEVVERRIAGAFYFGFKKWDRDKKGLQIDEFASSLLPAASKRKSSLCTTEEYNRLLQEWEELLKEIVGKLREGNFEPKPLDENQCDSCEWRNLCQAPHLQ